MEYDEQCETLRRLAAKITLSKIYPVVYKSETIDIKKHQNYVFASTSALSDLNDSEQQFLLASSFHLGRLRSIRLGWTFILPLLLIFYLMTLSTDSLSAIQVVVFYLLLFGISELLERATFMLSRVWLPVADERALYEHFNHQAGISALKKKLKSLSPQSRDIKMTQKRITNLERILGGFLISS
ncbi:MAG: hypothetical protein ACKVQS_03925 [Fimbriimonadaceae bacterium]